MEQNFSSEAKLLRQPRNSPRFMESGTSNQLTGRRLVCLLSQRNPVHNLPCFFKNHLNIIRSYKPGLRSGLFLSDFLTKILHEFLYCRIRATCPAPLQSQTYLAISTNYEAYLPGSAAFSKLGNLLS